jgi:pimeloyl-ACP methyl ester carboxylesterase
VPVSLAVVKSSMADIKEGTFIGTATVTQPDSTLRSLEVVVEWIENLIGGETRMQACYIRQNFTCLEHDTLAKLDRIGCPTLIMGGTSDPICSPTCTQWMANGIANSRVVMFDGCSHFFLIEQAQKFMSTLKDWLVEHS